MKKKTIILPCFVAASLLLSGCSLAGFTSNKSEVTPKASLSQEVYQEVEILGLDELTTNAKTSYVVTNTKNQSLKVTSWQASNSLLSIDEQGLVTTSKVAGSSEIIATLDNGQTVKKTLTIKKQQINLALEGASEIHLGATSSYNAMIDGKNAAVNWTLTTKDGKATSLASVSTEGLISAHEEAGVIKLTATLVDDPATSTSMEILLSKLVANKISVAGPTSVVAHQVATYQAGIAPEGASDEISWSVVGSNNEATTLATISSAGELKAGDGAGQVKVLAISKLDNSVQGSLAVAVVAVDATAVSIAGPSIVSAGKKAQYQASVLPVDASQEVTYEVFDKAGTGTTTLASISSEGLLDVKGVGVITLVATSKSTPTIKTSKLITLREALPTKLTIAGADTLQSGYSNTYTVTADDEHTNASVAWSLTNSDGTATNLAYINKKTGVLTSLNNGTGTIKVTATSTVVHSLSASVEVAVAARPTAQVSEIFISAKGGVSSAPVGATVQLNATVSPANSLQKVAWSSTDESVASVTSEGLVTTLSTGKATIKATAQDSSGIVASFEISGSATSVGSIVLTTEGDKSTGTIGSTLQVNATVKPDAATNKGITFSSSNESVMSVDANGLVSFLAIGNATITATAKDGSGISGSLNLSTIYALPTAVTIVGEDSMIIKSSLQLNATVTPTNARQAVTWSIKGEDGEDTTLASINTNGLVTSSGATGKVVVYATAKDSSEVVATKTIDIKYEATTAITVSSYKNQTGATIGTTLQLAATTNATTTGPVIWSSSNEDIATVSSAGLVQFVGEGPVTITATAFDNEEVSGSINLTTQVEGLKTFAEIKTLINNGLGANTYSFRGKIVAWVAGTANTFLVADSTGTMEMNSLKGSTTDANKFKTGDTVLINGTFQKTGNRIKSKTVNKVYPSTYNVAGVTSSPTAVTASEFDALAANTTDDLCGRYIRVTDAKLTKVGTYTDLALHGGEKYGYIKATKGFTLPELDVYGTFDLWVMYADNNALTVWADAFTANEPVAPDSLTVLSANNATTLDFGETLQMSVDPSSVSPWNGSLDVTWSIDDSKDTTGSTIDANGLLTAGTAAGDVIVKATSTVNTERAFTKTITITKPTINYNTITLDVSDGSWPTAYETAATAHTIGGIEIMTCSLYKDTNDILIKKSAGYLYNSTAIPGTIAKITISISSATPKKGKIAVCTGATLDSVSIRKENDTEYASNDAYSNRGNDVSFEPTTSNSTFFQILNSSSSGNTRITKIVISYIPAP